jgi:hypothetical protein
MYSAYDAKGILSVSIQLSNVLKKKENYVIQPMVPKNIGVTPHFWFLLKFYAH